ncbi:flagellar biosynthetic protein FliR [Nocardioides sp. Iso805N]|uniref:flagellar biosynthetic protein FliR n=1 Tax=Nocardioides sp. Iso805N TaxID=1283287 RepID=UPI000371877C|nr:flagellar biosynthetic protein FliR [Nocardioides sp. Iso805N]
MTISIDGTALIAYLLASVRIIAWLTFAPPFNNRSIPPMAKGVLGMGLAFAISPTLAASSLPRTTPELILVTGTQVMIGAAMGFATQLLFGAIQAAGSLIDLFGNFQIAAAYDPLSMNTNSVFGRFHEMLAVMLLFASGGDLLVVGGLLNTFHYLPLMASPDVSSWASVLTTSFGMFFSIAIQIALPMIAVLFIADLALALLTKVAPGLHAMNVMLPAKIGLTLLLVGMSFPVLPEALDRLTTLINQAMSTMAGGS